MNDVLLLGIDIGTYESKGVLCTPGGHVVAHASAGHEISMPHSGRAEHDAEAVWWNDFVLICRELLNSTGVDASQIASVGVSAIAPCVLPIDKEGKPLRPAILYGIDTRATEEIEELERALGRENIFESCGTNLSSQAAGPKILWIRKNEPDVWASTTMILTGSSYLIHKLTGEYVIDIYTASAYAPLFDVKRNAWNKDLDKLIAPHESLPRLLWSVEVAGTITPEAAKTTGLKAGTPVLAGAADAAAEALSAGLSNFGDLMLMYGSSQFFIQKTEELFISDVFWGHSFLEPNTYAVTAGMSTSGSITRWFRDEFAHNELNEEDAGGRDAYEALADLAATSPIGSNNSILLPYFSGARSPLNDPDARGMVVGLTLRHSRADLYRAILEGVGYGIRHNIDIMKDEGIAPQRILAVGGGTKNPLWLQIVSDITGVDQLVPTHAFGAAHGDAFLAGMGIELFNSTAQASSWVDYKTVIKPNPRDQQKYEPLYHLYRQIYKDNAKSMHSLSSIDSIS